MRVCFVCGDAIHEHQAERPALLAIHQAGDRRAYQLCGECARRIEAGLNRRRLVQPVDAPLVTITR